MALFLRVVFSRASIVFFLFIAAYFLILTRLIEVQIKKGGYYEALALGQHMAFQESLPQRGDIFFSSGALPITQAKTKNLLKVLPTIKQTSGGEKELQVILSFLTEDQEKQDLEAALEQGSIFKKEISEQDFEKIRKLNLDFAMVEKNIVRFYPYNNLASNVIGFVNNEGEGQYGVEGYYNESLKGNNEFQGKGQSPYGYLPFLGEGLEVLENQDKGADIWLTIDYNIQYFAEKLLKQAKESWDIDRGQIVVFEPKTGKIIALTSFPNFNPNEFSKEQNLAVFLNPVVQLAFEPGSVFKPITMAAGLQEGLVNVDTTYEDKGCVQLGGPPICNFGKRVWGESTMMRVLQQSINTGAVFVEEKLGKEMFLKYASDFGFFEKTGIDLQGEVFSENRVLKQGYPRDFASASFGQGIEITPLQLVRAFGAIACQGKLMKPYIVEKIIKPDKTEIITEPKFERQVVSVETAKTLSEMLEKVVETGSASRARIDGYSIAGKTGTAQVALKEGGYSQDQTVQSFIGFFPVSSPRFLVLVKLDNPKGVNESAKCAVPLARELMKSIIDLKQIPPDKKVDE